MRHWLILAALLLVGCMSDPAVIRRIEKVEAQVAAVSVGKIEASGSGLWLAVVVVAGFAFAAFVIIIYLWLRERRLLIKSLRACATTIKGSKNRTGLAQAVQLRAVGLGVETWLKKTLGKWGLLVPK